MFSLNNRNYLCLVDYHSKFSVVKRIESISAESVTLLCKISFIEYGLPKKIMSDAGSKYD